MSIKKIFLFSFLALTLGGAIFGAWNIFAQNTPIGVLHGIGWSAHNDRGIGWVVLNSDDAIGLGGEKFKVFVGADNKLDGRGWASIKDPKTGKDSYGWLVFGGKDSAGKDYLDNCPETPCKAMVNPSNGTISGWAKFICVAGGCPVGSSVGSWDGWVSLRNTDNNALYGLCLGSVGTKKYVIDDPSGGQKTLITGESCSWDGSNTEVNGLAWGGPNIGGWIMFGFASSPSTAGINPSGPYTLFPREKRDVSVANNASWLVNDISGGNASIGTIAPVNTLANAIAVYQASNAGGPYTIKASTTLGVATTTATVKFPYTITCDPVGTSTMSVQWRWSKSPVDTGHDGGYLAYAPQKISITRNGGNTSVLNRQVVLSEIPGSLLDTGLSSSTIYTYALKVDYSNPAYSTSTKVENCAFVSSPTTTDTPSKLRAFATDASTIFVNWKDNTTTTKPYKFTVQRIKLTPASSTQIKVTATDDSSVTVFWKNNTTSTPYYNWVERSTSTSNRFLDNPFPNTAGNDKAMVRVEYPGNTIPSGSKDYSFYDSGLQDATTYYYRVRACSTYRDAPLNEAYDNKRILGEVDRPNPVCGTYAPDPNSAMIGYGGGTPSVATTTLPKTPTKATSTASFNKSSGVHSITLRWDDNSKRETGYQILRDGVLIDERVYNTNATGTLSHIDSPTSNNKNTSSLDAGTNYSYEIRAYYVIPAENGGDGTARVYSDPASTDTTTYYRVTVQIAGDGGGTITGPGDLNNCSSSCVDWFNGATIKEIGLSASSDGQSEFTGWGGVSCKEGNTSASCTFTNNGNYEVYANFRRNVFDLTASVTGLGKIIGSGINCGTTCSTSIGEGALVSLSAVPNSTTTELKSWGGKCSGTNLSCTFSMPSGNANVSAVFGLKSTSTVNIQKGSFFADLWSNAKYMWKGLFADHSEERVSALSASLSNIVKGVKDGWKNITALFSEMMRQAEFAAEQAARNSAEIAEGQGTGNPLDMYFKTVATTTAPVYIDKNLEADTVYLYRVRAFYEDGSNRVTEWSNSGATKTMRNTGGAGISNRGVCTRNSYCDFSVKAYNSSSDQNEKVKTENTEQQCTQNIDCKDVGRYGQSFQER